MRHYRVLCIVACCAALAAPAGARAAVKRDRTIRIDSLRDDKGAMLYRLQCTDIAVHLRDGRWIAEDSIKFFSEHHKVQVASTVLKNQVEHFHDSLQVIMDSAGAYVARGRYTKPALDSVITSLQHTLEQTINTHNYSLRRLEDYQTVLNAVKPLLHGADPR